MKRVMAGTAVERVRGRGMVAIELDTRIGEQEVVGCACYGESEQGDQPHAPCSMVLYQPGNEQPQQRQACYHWTHYSQ